MSELDVESLEQDLAARFRKVELREGYKPELAIAQFLALCGLRGFWPMSSFDENGDAFDLSEQNRTLTYNGNPVYGYDGLAPYIEMDGAGDYLERADEAGLDILGTEAYVAVPGLTCGGWILIDDLTADRTLMGKWITGTNNRSYFLYYRNATAALRFSVSVDGIASTNVDDTFFAPPSTGQWYFLVGRFTPSTELAIFVNNRKTTLAVGVPAAIFNSNAALRVGAYGVGGAAGALDGKLSFDFLCSSALSDGIVSALFQQTRSMFGV